VLALIDTGATGIGYISKELARNLKLCLTALPHMIYPTGFTGTPLKGGEITYTAKLTLKQGDHQEQIRLFVTQTGYHKLILGQPWMYKHRVGFDY
ncbi:hypothetical protein GQ43DRAFT_356008, partial [Delitschia confertaspora ATCC 74209]